MNKQKLRQKIKSKREKQNAKNKAEKDQAVWDRLSGANLLNKYTAYFVYLSFGSETDTLKIIEFLLQNNKEVYVPKVYGEVMRAVKFAPPFITNKFGITEPTNDIVAEKIDLSITPLVACDENFNRIGYGKGYYDKFFKENPCIKIGICYNFQVVKAIEAEATDVKLDYIITDKKTLTRME